MRGTVEKSRNYLLMLQSKTRCKINASTRVPFFTSSKCENCEVHTATLGSIIECNAVDLDSILALNCSFESSLVAPGRTFRSLGRSGSRPMDDPSSGNRLEILVVAERALTGRP